MVTLIDRKSKTSIFSRPSMDSKIGSYGTVWGDKNTKIDDRNFFFQYKQLFEITFYVCMEAFIDPLASIQLFYCILRDED